MQTELLITSSHFQGRFTAVNIFPELRVNGAAQTQGTAIQGWAQGLDLKVNN